MKNMARDKDKKGATKWHQNDERVVDRGGRTCPTCGGAKKITRKREAMSVDDPDERYSDDEEMWCPECNGKGTI